MEIVWKDSFKLLGINFDNLLNHMERNIDDKIEKMKGTMKKWEYKILSPIGRQNVTKTFITSQLAHVGFVQIIDNKTITKIEQMLHNFIWQKKSYCKKEDAKARLEKGGFDLIDLKSSLKSFHISWIRRLYLNYNSDKEWVQTVKSMLKDIKVEPETLWTKGTKTFNHIARKIKSNFWKKVFESVVTYTEIESQQNTEFILNQNLWDSHLYYENGNIPTDSKYSSLKKKNNKTNRYDQIYR